MNRGIAVIDNYDSFTYNLVHMINRAIKGQVDVYRNDEIELQRLDQYETLILSPGPGIPSEAGKLLNIIRKFAPSKKILGVCLGQQAIGEVFGGKLKNLTRVYHGVKTPIIRTGIPSLLYKDIPGTFEAGRYHSWVIDKNSLPDCLEVTCHDENGEIMGIQHTVYGVYGVQYHPESILTALGPTLIENFLFKCKNRYESRIESTV